MSKNSINYWEANLSNNFTQHEHEMGRSKFSVRHYGTDPNLYVPHPGQKPQSSKTETQEEVKEAKKSLRPSPKAKVKDLYQTTKELFQQDNKLQDAIDKDLKQRNIK